MIGLTSGFSATATWAVLLCLIGLVWLRRHIELNRARREPVLAPSDADGDPAALPSLSVLVAGKDEESNIGRCLEGLLAQDYPRLQVIVINDRSADRTGEIIDEWAKRDPRVVAVHVTELRAGWFGKNNAMRAGQTHATGAWLCFSDADCVYDSPKLLAAAVRFALREQVGFLSVLPRLEASTLWERVVQPVAGAIMVLWNPPQKVNDPRSSRAYANGAFMLLARPAYEAIGGHEPVKATLNEDMHMARIAKQVGVRLRVILGGGMYRVRMYTGFAQIWRGWSRIFYGCFGTLPRLLASIVMLSVFSISPYVTLLASPLAGAEWWRLGVPAAFAIVAQQTVLWRFYRVSEMAGGWALTYPLGALVCLGMTLSAILKALGAAGTTWRGTTYTGGAQAREGAPGGSERRSDSL
ncbi:MAG: glycosyltransferase family 2 protein [Planctomycetes bacterium]|nr:glycosyltransferase family 2 protein [Planctomycetota bacterium]